MRTLCLVLFTAATLCNAQEESGKDRRVERAKGYHIISRPARTGETPPEVRQEKGEEDRLRRNSTDLSNQSAPTRQPEIKPKALQP